MIFEYRRELAGGAVLTLLDVDSELLRGNPLGDPHERSHPLLLPPDPEPGLPLVTVLVGYTGFNHKVVNKSSLWEPSLPELLATAMEDGTIPRAVFLWPSCETRLGGSQYVDSPGTGPYMASCYSPDPDAALGFDLPVDPVTGKIRHQVFARWLEFDPLQLVEQES